MKVISLGYGRQLFSEYDIELARLKLCAEKVESFDMVIFTRKSEGQQIKQVTDKFTLHPTNSKNRLWMLLDAYKIINRILRESDEKIVLSVQDPFEIGLLGLLLSWHRKNVILQVQEHADVYSEKFWRNESILNFIRYYIGILVFKKADLIRVVSVRIEKTLSDRFGLGNKIRRLPVAIKAEVETNSFEQVGRDDGQKNFVFLSMARFVPQKNFPLMLRAFKNVWENNNNVRLHIYGKGPEEEKIKTIIAELFGGTSKEIPVQVQGWSDSVPELMQQADAYLLTSNYEGWARVLIEAVLYKLPIVTTDVGCAGEVVINDVHGRVVPIANELVLVEAMNEILNDGEYYRRIKRNLHSLAVEDIPGTDFEHYGIKWVSSLS